MENASRAFLDAVRKSMRQIRTVIGATTIDPKLLTAAERIQYEGYLRREETTNAAIAQKRTSAPQIRTLMVGMAVPDKCPLPSNKIAQKGLALQPETSIAVSVMTSCQAC